MTLSNAAIAIKPLSLAIALTMSDHTLYAQTPEEIANQQVQRQQQQDAARQTTLTPHPTVNIDTAALTSSVAQPVAAPNTTDSPCFTIQEIALTALDKKAFHDLPAFDAALVPAIYGNASLIGQCLGSRQINQLANDVQNRIIERGYATTRVVIGNQNLSHGKLLLTIIPGYLDQINANTQHSRVPVYLDHTGLPANFANALPLKTGELLNIRELETGLENLKRVPSADADFSISPSTRLARPGYSDVLIQYAQAKKLRVGLGIDDAGAKATGKYQGNLILSLDNPSWHNDLLYLTYGRDLGKTINDQLPGDKGSENYALGYSLPVNRWLFSTNLSHYTYHQTVAGANQDYTYRGESDNATVNTSYLVDRDATSKTYLNAGGFVKSQNNYIDDTEVDVQRRKIAGWTAGLTHERNMGDTSLRTELTYQRGTGAFDALNPPESLFNEGSARTGIIKASVALTRPMRLPLPASLGPSNLLSYSGRLSGQYAMDALVPSERMAIGGRYTVRGFDGERTLSGDQGVLLRQDVSMPLGKRPHALYAGLDAGYVAMKNPAQNDLLLGHTLVGAAVGLKGQLTPLHASYDVFTGYPIKQPNGFGDKHWASGISLNLEF